MCKNFITSNIKKKTVILSCQRIDNVHEIDSLVRKHPLEGVLKNELFYWSFSIITTTIQADNSTEQL